jgi:hypothetical protein
MEANRRLSKRDIGEVSRFENERAMKEFDHYRNVRLAGRSVTEM